MIIDPAGRPLKPKVTEAPFPARLFDMIVHLADTLAMQGVELRCVRCGQPLQGSNHPSDPTFYLDCGCARRTFERIPQKQSATLHEAVKV